MPKVVFKQEFRFSPNGYDIIVYDAAPEAVEVSDRCAEVALEAGAAVVPEVKKAKK
jgi:hypothetical protein